MVDLNTYFFFLCAWCDGICAVSQGPVHTLYAWCASQRLTWGICLSGFLTYTFKYGLSFEPRAHWFNECTIQVSLWIPYLFFHTGITGRPHHTCLTLMWLLRTPTLTAMPVQQQQAIYPGLIFFIWKQKGLFK